MVTTTAEVGAEEDVVGAGGAATELEGACDGGSTMIGCRAVTEDERRGARGGGNTMIGEEPCAASVATLASAPSPVETACAAGAISSCDTTTAAELGAAAAVEADTLGTATPGGDVNSEASDFLALVVAAVAGDNVTDVGTPKLLPKLLSTSMGTGAGRDSPETLGAAEEAECCNASRDRFLPRFCAELAVVVVVVVATAELDADEALGGDGRSRGGGASAALSLYQ